MLPMTGFNRLSVSLAWLLSLSLALGGGVPSAQATGGEGTTPVEALFALNQRPTIAEILGAFGGRLPPQNPFGRPTPGLQEALEANMPQVIAAFEKAFPGATFASLGRDSVLLGNALDAFYTSIGQPDRVRRVNASKQSLTQRSGDILQFLRGSGFDLPRYRKQAPFVIFDQTTFLHSSQSRQFLFEIYKECRQPDCDRKELFEKFNFINTGALIKDQNKVFYSENLIDPFFDIAGFVKRAAETSAARKEEPNEIMSVAVDPSLTYTAAYHGKFSVFKRDPVQGVVTRPGALSDEAVRRQILADDFELIKTMSSGRFLLAVRAQARIFGYEFPLNRVTDAESVSRIRSSGQKDASILAAFALRTDDVGVKREVLRSLLKQMVNSVPAFRPAVYERILSDPVIADLVFDEIAFDFWTDATPDLKRILGEIDSVKQRAQPGQPSLIEIFETRRHLAERERRVREWLSRPGFVLGSDNLGSVWRLIHGELLGDGRTPEVERIVAALRLWRFLDLQDNGDLKKAIAANRLELLERLEKLGPPSRREIRLVRDLITEDPAAYDFFSRKLAESSQVPTNDVGPKAMTPWYVSAYRELGIEAVMVERGLREYEAALHDFPVLDASARQSPVTSENGTRSLALLGELPWGNRPPDPRWYRRLLSVTSQALDSERISETDAARLFEKILWHASKSPRGNEALAEALRKNGESLRFVQTLVPKFYLGQTGGRPVVDGAALVGSFARANPDLIDIKTEVVRFAAGSLPRLQVGAPAAGVSRGGAAAMSWLSVLYGAVDSHSAETNRGIQMGLLEFVLSPEFSQLMTRDDHVGILTQALGLLGAESDATHRKLADLLRANASVRSVWFQYARDQGWRLANADQRIALGELVFIDSEPSSSRVDDPLGTLLIALPVGGGAPTELGQPSFNGAVFARHLGSVLSSQTRTDQSAQISRAIHVFLRGFADKKFSAYDFPLILGSALKHWDPNDPSLARLLDQLYRGDGDFRGMWHLAGDKLQDADTSLAQRHRSLSAKLPNRCLLALKRAIRP